MTESPAADVSFNRGLALRLEQMGRSGEMEGGAEVLAQLRGATERACAALREVVRGPAAR